MAVRFKRVFGLYTFFSVFLPGAMFLLGIAPFVNLLYQGATGNQLVTTVASNRLVTLLGVLVFVTLGMFVGFILHSLGALFEQKIGGVELPDVEELLGYDLDWMIIRVGHRHRKLFHEMLNGRYDAAYPDLVSLTVEAVNEQFPRLDLDPEAPQHTPSDGTTGRQSSVDGWGEEQVSKTAEGGTGDQNSEVKKSGPLPVMVCNLASSVVGFAQRGRALLSLDRKRGEDSEDEVVEREDRILKGESDAIYTVVRSRVHMDKTGRSRTFRAVVASCRSMLVAWFFLTALYTFLVGGMVLVEVGVTASTLPIPKLLRQLVSWLWFFEAKPPSLENLTRAFSVVVIAGFVGTYGLASVVRNYKRHYLEYLVSDYLLLYHESDDEDGQTDQQTTVRPRFRSN